MPKTQPTNQQTNAYEVTDNKSKWGDAIQSLAAEFMKIKSSAASSRTLRACRDNFYRIFWDLSRSKAKGVLWSRGLGGVSEDAEDAASEATKILLKQECAGAGLFGRSFPDIGALCAYLSGAICQGIRQRVDDLLAGHRRARGLWPEDTEALMGLADPRQEEFKWKQVCMDVREVSMSIAPKYKGRLPLAGKTPMNQVLLDVCLERMEGALAKRTEQRLKKDIREDLRATMGF